ncbi:MAG: hypothetical protein R2710_11365 [Acidimicrobiales bacterium]
MAIALLIVAAVLIVALGFAFTGWAVGKTETMPDQIVVDAHEAIEFCAQALPDHITAEISYDDLRRVLRMHLEWIQAYDFSPEGVAEGPIVFEQFDAIGYVLERADVNHLAVTPEQVAAIIQAHSDYLQVMGAIHIEDPVKVQADLAELPMLPSAADDDETTSHP